MSTLVDHINKAAPEMGDLTTDRPATHRWLPTPVTPVLATPAALAVVVIFAALANAGTGGGGGGGCRPHENGASTNDICP